MRRYGPLIAVPDALAVGDPGRHHLRLTSHAVIAREGAENRGIHLWERIERITIDVPTTGFRLPGLLGTLLLGALTAVLLSDPGIEPDDAAVELHIDGGVQRLPLSRHHVGGYWAPTVIGAQRLIDHLLSNADQRVLLAHPERLIDLAASLARQDATRS